MMRLTLQEIGQAMHGVGDYDAHPDLAISRIQTDSRLVEPGDLFVCIPGERFDGHSFAREAVHKGAAGVVVERPLMDLHSEVPMILVQNSIHALGHVAAECRRRFTGTVVAITGTAGKTTVKEFIASILSTGGEVGRNYKNWNNEIGVPQSILSFSGREDFWVLEAGVSNKGDMEILARMIRPDLAVITNVGAAHLEGLRDIHGVAREKMTLASFLQASGTLVVSADYPALAIPEEISMAVEVVTFSLGAGQARYGLSQDEAAPGEELVLDLDGQTCAVHTDLFGAHNQENILAAAAAVHVLGFDCQAIQEGVRQACIPEHRSQVSRIGPYVLIDDSYNANPLSMHCALNSARDLAGDEPLILVLGEMKELGASSPSAHVELGRMAARTGAEILFFTGEHHEAVRKGFQDEAPGKTMLIADTVDEFRRQWKRGRVRKGVILVKGSRGVGLERYVSVLNRELLR
jgi:UDP-N-acetylmuramoyl-tripeptide--D-alanyl-D-alanine ligase